MESRSTTSILIGLLLSVVLHAMLLVPALVAVLTVQANNPGRLNARFKPEFFRESETPPEVELGLDRPAPKSTLTWIGYEDYQEHLAALADVEQAAFQTTPQGAEPAWQDQPSPQEQHLEAAEDQTASPKLDPLETLETWLKSADKGEGPPEGDAVKPDAQHQALADALEDLQRMLELSVARAPAPARAQPAGKPGAQSDLESDASSTIDVPMDQLKLGKPLAAHGLVLKPRQPEFTALTKLTAVPSNPVVELRFRRDGKPSSVRFVHGSGDPRIDEALLNSLYRWRAAGKKLTELKGKQTIPIRIRILLLG